MEIGCTIAPKRYGRYYPNIGIPDFARVFCKPGEGLKPLTSDAVTGLPEGTKPWFSHKDPVPLDQVADHWHALMAKTRRTRERVHWTYFHEAAGDGAPPLADYLGYWRDLIALAEDFPQVELVQIQSLYAMRWRVDTDWRDWIIPGVALGVDCYPLGMVRYEPPESMFGMVRAMADHAGIEAWGVPELGADLRPRQDRGRWLRECVEYLGDRGAAFVGLWGSGGEYEPYDPTTLAAFRDIVNR